MSNVGFEWKFDLHRTPTGRVGLWESGGGTGSYGHCKIVAGPNGTRKRPIYVTSRWALGDHGLFQVTPGDLVIVADRDSRATRIFIWEVTEVAVTEGIAKVRLACQFDGVKWAPSEPTGMLTNAVAAAQEKANCLLCRHVHWRGEGQGRRSKL